MKTIIFLFFLAVSLVANQIVHSQESDKITGSFDYLGQTPPGDSLELFAPGIISDPGTREGALAISPKGDEIFFNRGLWPYSKIMHMVKKNGQWSRPDTAGFSKSCWATEPAFSADGKYLVYSSSNGKSDIKNYNLWRVRKEGTGWSEPESLFDIGSDSIWEFHPTVSYDGSLYFCYWNAKNSTGDIYASQCAANVYSEPVDIGTTINTDSSDVDPYIAPNETYIIFASTRPGGYGGFDHFISFRNNDGTWTNPKNLGSGINTSQDDYDIDVSPDGKFLFIYMNDDIYWRRSGNIITGLKD